MSDDKINHAAMVSRLTKPGVDILATMTPEMVNLWHLATGVSGEAGELLDAIKKHVVYNKPLDIDNVIEELGDLEFYLEGLRQALRITRETVLDANIHKLVTGPNARYKDAMYSDSAAQARADKQIGIGSIVKIARKSTKSLWVPAMDKTLGMVGTVNDFEDNDPFVDIEMYGKLVSYFYPIECLELVTQTKE